MYDIVLAILQPHSKNMDVLNVLKISTLACVSLLGNACYTGAELGSADKPYVTFDLPEGWTMVDSQPGYFSAVTEQPPIIKVELVPNETFPGTEGDAEAYAQKLVSFYAGSTPPIQRDDVFEEVLLPGGETLYTHIVPDYFEGGAEPTRSSRVIYHRDGHVVNLYFSADASLYTKELSIIASSTEVSGGRKQ